MLKRNPREVTWTVLYRRKHKKGLEEETAKKRNKRTQKFQRAVVGATLQVSQWIVFKFNADIIDIALSSMKIRLFLS